MSISDFGAWYGSISPVIPGIVLKSHKTFSNTAGGTQVITITAPSAGDCVVMGISVAGATSVGASGLGATWVQTPESNTPAAILLIGYNCSGSGATITLTGLSGSAGDMVIGVFSGLSTSNPVISSQGATANGVSTLTTPSLSYSAHDLVIGVSALNSTTALTTPTWGDGASNTNVATSFTERSCRLDYEIPNSSSSTTFTANASGSDDMRALVMELSHL